MVRIHCKCAQGVSNAVVRGNLAKPCFNYNFKGVYYRFNCIYKHNCMICSLAYPAITCLRFHIINIYQTLGNRLKFNNPSAADYRPTLLNPNHRPVLRLREKFTLTNVCQWDFCIVCHFLQMFKIFASGN